MDTLRERHDPAERRSLLALRILRELIDNLAPIAGDKSMLMAIEAEIGPRPPTSIATTSEAPRHE